MVKCSVVGAGAWGTAIATALDRAGSDVTIWALEEEVVESINLQNENTVYLNGVKLSKNIKATNSFEEIGNAELIYLVSPSQFARATCKQLLDAGLSKDIPIVICCKGVENNTLMLMNEVVKEILDNNICVMSGPTFASEVARGLPASVSLACQEFSIIDLICRSIESETFKIFPTDDIVGAEVGSAIKNVIAIACGIAEGSGLGENAKAALMVRGLREMKTICLRKSGNPDTLMQLCGVGDLILTASSQESRNFSLGYELGQGKTLEQIMEKRNTVAEGVASSESLHMLSDTLNIDLPVCETVYKIVHGKEDIVKTIGSLVKES